MRFAPALLVAGLMVSSAAGCGLLNLRPGRTIHQKCGWKAEDYFTDPKVIAAAVQEFAPRVPTKTVAVTEGGAK